MDRYSSKPLADRSSLVRPYWVFMVVFTILTLFVTYLMVKVYQSSSLLAQAGKSSFAQETKTRTANLDAYLERVRSDVENLARNKAIQAYYQNKALGMSLEYGLSIAVSEVGDEFGRLLKTLNIRGLPVFSQINLLDSRDMSEIAGTFDTSPLKSSDISHLDQNIRETVVFPLFTAFDDNDNSAVFVVTRVVYKAETKGYLVMKLNLDTLRAQIETDAVQNNEDFFLLVDSYGSIFVGPSDLMGRNVLSAFGISPSELESFVVTEVAGKAGKLKRGKLIVSGAQISGTSFYLLGFARSHKYLAGYSTELWLMVFTALISGLLIMILFIYRSWEDQSITYGQLQEARDTLETRVTERTRELADTNQLLQKEIRARSGVEESLRLSETKYRDLFEHASDMIFTIDTEGNLSSVNGVVASILGYTPEEFIALNLNSIIDPESRPIFREKFFSIIRDYAGFSAPFELLARSRSGAAVWLELTSRLISSGSAVTGLHCIARDITERKQLESEIHEAQIKYRSVVEAFDGLIHITSADYKIQFANQRLVERTGYDPLGKNCYEVVHGLQHPCEWCISREVSSTEICRSELLSPKDNRWYYVVSSPMAHQDGSVSRIFLMHDIDQRKRSEDEREKLEQNLIRAQRMEAVGTLAGGIAHDFNNLLQVVLGYSQLLLRVSRFEPGDRENLQKIHRAAYQGSELVKNLMAFSSKAQTRPSPVNINDHVEELIDLLERIIPRMIKIELELEEGLPVINADSGQLKQIFMNLALNARDAMPDGGVLKIKTAKVSIDADYCMNHLEAKPGHYVAVIFSDTGVGMDKQTLEHIFEPFYTTKEVGKGTGLGLSMVFGMIKQHDGFIMLDSLVNEGSEFRVYLPVTDIAEEQSSTEKEVPKKQTPAFGSILLVDDEDMVRDLGADYLTEMGYTVRTASNGRQAIEIYRDNQAQISLVLLDLIMPEMSGKVCLAELLKINPDVKVVVVSGYCSDETPGSSSNLGARGFVNKPYDLDGLLNTIQKVLRED